MKKLMFGFVMFLMLPAIAYSNGRYGMHMYDCDYIRGYGGVFMWIIFLVILGFVVYYIVQDTKSKESGSPSGETPSGETPLDILKKRFAKGEIKKEEFEQMKKDLED